MISEISRHKKEIKCGANLLVNTDSVQPCVHDVDPTVFRRKDKQGHQGLSHVVEIVGPIDPRVTRIGR